MNAVELDGITKSFGGRAILNNISFNVTKGHIHGLLGPNGAGKTTSMRIITSLLGQDSGTIKINGEIQTPFKQNTHQSLGFLLDEPPLYGEMSVKEYLTFVGKLKRLKGEVLSKNLNYCLEKLDLSQVFDRSIENLSKGFKQRVGIAQALIHMPEILILDEPTAGLDPQSVIEIRNLILELKTAHTVIISSHLLHEMSLVCDDLTIISNGEIKETGTLEDLRRRIAGKAEVFVRLKERSEEFLNYLINREDILNVDVKHSDQGALYSMQCIDPVKVSPEIISQAVSLKLSVLGLEQREFTLEEIFMRIVKP